MSKQIALLSILLVMSIVVTACDFASTPVPTSTPTPTVTATALPMVGCNAWMDPMGILWFNEPVAGARIYIENNNPYVYQLSPYSYYRAECIAGLPRVTLGNADAKCKANTITFQIDGGWSCWLSNNKAWISKTGGSYIWPRGKPTEIVDPTPMAPPTPNVILDAPGMNA